MSEPDLALIDLKAVGKENKDPVRNGMIQLDEFIVKVNNKSLKRLLPVLQKGSDEHERGIKNLKIQAAKQFLH
jgi:hypothetical protein